MFTISRSENSISCVTLNWGPCCRKHHARSVASSSSIQQTEESDSIDINSHGVQTTCTVFHQKYRLVGMHFHVIKFYGQLDFGTKNRQLTIGPTVNCPFFVPKCHSQLKTGAVFLDLTAAYDTVWHTGLLYKLSKDMPHWFVRLIELFLRDRRFRVHIGDDTSAWRTQVNGLPQGSVLSPTLFNLYTPMTFL